MAVLERVTTEPSREELVRYGASLGTTDAVVVNLEVDAADVVLDAGEGFSHRLERTEFIASGDVAVAPSHRGGGAVAVIDANKHGHVRFGDGHFVVVSAFEIKRGGHETKGEVQGGGAGSRGLLRTAVFFPERRVRLFTHTRTFARLEA